MLLLYFIKKSHNFCFKINNSNTMIKWTSSSDVEVDLVLVWSSLQLSRTGHRVLIVSEGIIFHVVKFCQSWRLPGSDTLLNHWRQLWMIPPDLQHGCGHKANTCSWLLNTGTLDFRPDLHKTLLEVFSQDCPWRTLHILEGLCIIWGTEACSKS